MQERHSSASTMILALALIVCAGGSLASEERALFRYPVNARVEYRFDDDLRNDVLSALASDSRDSLLAQYVDRYEVQVARDEYESWYDLRGIYIGKNDLPREARFERVCLDGAVFESVIFDGCDLSSTLLRGAVFTNCSLRHVVFDGASLTDASFTGCDLTGATFRQAILQGEANFRSSTLDSTLFDHGWRIGGLRIIGGSIRNAGFRGADLSGCRFFDADIRGSDFSGANLTDAIFARSRIDNVVLNDANITGARFSSVVLTSPLRLVRTILDRARLGDLDLRLIDLSYVRWNDFERFVGEEIAADALKYEDPAGAARDEGVRLYSQAESIYRALSQKYNDLGYGEEYKAMRYRSFEVRRKILRLQGRSASYEYIWLSLYRYASGYGCRWSVLARSLVVAFAVFTAMHYVSWTVFRRREWVLWSRLAGRTKLLDIDAAESATSETRHTYTTIETAFRRRGRSWQFKFWLLHEASVLSIYGIVLPFERVIDLPGVLQLLIERDVQPVAMRYGRTILGLQAVSGLIFALLAAEILVSSI